jgi:hypothetical protein
MKDVIAAQGAQIKYQMAQGILSRTVSEFEILPVIKDLVVFDRINVQHVGFPAKIAERAREVPGVVIALADIEHPAW